MFLMKITQELRSTIEWKFFEILSWFCARGLGSATMCVQYTHVIALNLI